MPWICSKISNESKVRYAGQGAKQWILWASDTKKNPQKIFKSVLKILSKKLPRNAFLPLTRRRAVTIRCPKIAPILFRNRSPSRSSSCFLPTSLWKALNSSPKNSIFLVSVAAGEICFAYFFLSKSPSFNPYPTVFMPRSQGQTRKRQKNFHPLLPARKSVLPADLLAIGRVLSDAGKLKKIKKVLDCWLAICTMDGLFH